MSGAEERTAVDVILGESGRAGTAIVLDSALHAYPEERATSLFGSKKRLELCPRIVRHRDAGLVAPRDGIEIAAEIGPLLVLYGLGDGLRAALPGRAVTVFGVEGWPACGTPAEALRFHALDGASVAERIAAQVGRRAASRAAR